MSRHPRLRRKVLGVGQHQHLHRFLVRRRGIHRRAMNQLVSFGGEVDKSAHSQHGGDPLVLHHFQDRLALAALRFGSGRPRSLSIADRMEVPAGLRRGVAIIDLAALHDDLERFVAGQAVILLLAHRSGENALDDLEVVGHRQKVSHQTVEGLVGDDLLGGTAARAGLLRGSRRFLLSLRLRAALQGALAGLLLFLQFGQVELDNRGGATLQRHFASLGTPLRLGGRDLLQHLLGLGKLAGDVDHDRQRRLAGRGGDQPDRGLPAGYAFHVVQRQPQPLVDARPAGLELAVDILGEGLHHRIGHQVAELSGVPVLLEGVDVRDGEEPLRGVGQQGFAGTDCLGRYALDAARQQPTASTARDPNPETRHCTTPCVNWQGNPR